MIATTLMIRACDTALWLEFVRHRFRRFESVARGGGQLLVWIGTVGSLLLTESVSARRIVTQPAPNRSHSWVRFEAEDSPEVITLRNSANPTC